MTRRFLGLSDGSEDPDDLYDRLVEEVKAAHLAEAVAIAEARPLAMPGLLAEADGDEDRLVELILSHPWATAGPGSFAEVVAAYEEELISWEAFLRCVTSRWERGGPLAGSGG